MNDCFRFFLEGVIEINCSHFRSGEINESGFVDIQSVENYEP